MNNQDSIQDQLALLAPLAPQGYALVLHLRFAAPTFLLQTYDHVWRDHYSEKGFAFTDPVVRWGFENRGTTTWEALRSDDPAGVLQDAADHGLKYGIVCSVGTEQAFSFGGFARSDRAYTQEETDQLTQIMQRVHDLTDDLQALSPETAKALTALSIQYTHPAAS